MYKVNFNTRSYECSECGSNNLEFVKENIFHCENCNYDLIAPLSSSAEVWKHTLIRKQKLKIIQDAKKR